VSQKLHDDLLASQLFDDALAARVVSHELADVVRGNGQHQRVSARLQQVDQHLEQLVVLLDETRSVLAPKTLRFVDRTPLQSAGFDLSGVLVE